MISIRSRGNGVWTAKTLPVRHWQARMSVHVVLTGPSDTDMPPGDEIFEPSPRLGRRCHQLVGLAVQLVGLSVVVQRDACWPAAPVR
jgi:hypothetical protein